MSDDDCLKICKYFSLIEWDSIVNIKRFFRAFCAITTAAILAVSTTTTANAGVISLCRGKNSYHCLAFSGYGPTTGTWADVRYPGSPNGHNCTRYVAYRLAKGGVPDQGTWGNAGEWIRRAPNAKDHNPTVGAVAYWSPDWTRRYWGHGWGHVGVVEAVNGDGSIDVTWDSYGDGFAVRERVSAEHLPTMYLHIDDGAIARSGGHTGPPPGKIPVGHLDTAEPGGPGVIHVRGWTYDPDDASVPLRVHIYIGGTYGDPQAEGHEVVTNVSRPDAHAQYNVGFDHMIPTAKTGVQDVCAYGINIGGGTDNTFLGCIKSEIKTANPVGHLDTVDYASPGVIHVRGWSFDPNDESTPLMVHVYVGGLPGDPNAEGHQIMTNVSRPDVHAQYNVGFDHMIHTKKTGVQSVCAYGINIGLGNDNTSLGCKDVDIKEGPAPDQPPADDDPQQPDNKTQSSGIAGVLLAIGGLAAAVIAIIAALMQAKIIPPNLIPLHT